MLFLQRWFALTITEAFVVTLTPPEAQKLSILSLMDWNE